MGRTPDVVTPRTIEEKFLWRKIFDHNPLFVVVTDKQRARKYIREVMPDLHQAELFWSGIDVDAIPASLLRGNVAIKANNGSGRVLLVVDGQVDRAELKRKASAWLKPYKRGWGEWAYTHVTRCILIEELLLEGRMPVQSEYKFHVGGGRTSYVFTRIGRSPEEREIVLSRDGVPYGIDDEDGKPLTDASVSQSFIRMRDIAEKLAAPFDFVRCDLYDLGEKIYFSELTVYPLSGYGTVKNRKLREQRNRDWDLRRSWFLTTPQRGWRRLYAEALREYLSL